jgi:IclR family transcriptional regulator, KDG regulon repressor
MSAKSLRASGRPSVQAVSVALNILELLAMNDGPTRLTDLARQLGTSKNRIYRHLQTLIDCGYATRDEDSQRYSPGIRLLQLGNAVANQYDLVKVSRPIMRQLRDELRLAVVTSKVVDDQVYAVEHLLSPSTDAVWIFIGTHLDLHSSAQGKLVLAYGRADLLETITEDKLVAHTALTITSRHRLRKDIQKVRERGWAVSLGERQQGVHSLAAPIMNAHKELFATLAVVGLASELRKESLAKIATSLTNASEQISAMLFDTSLRPRRLRGVYPVRL